jgi:hypothetical protein
MSLKQFTIDFQELAKETSNRFDVDFINFNVREDKERYSFKDFFNIDNSTKKERLDLVENIEDDFYYAEIGNATKQGDVEPEKLNFLSRNELVEDNILLAKVRPNLKKYVFIDKENKDYFYTTAFINLKPKKLNKIFYYSFRTIFYNDLMAISRQGKGYPTLKDNDLFYLKFNKTVIDKLEKAENQIVAQIEPIEKKIRELKNQIAPAQGVINKVFARESGFDLEKFEKLKKEKFFEVEISKFDTPLTRSTVVQNSLKANYLKNFLKQKSIVLKNIITKPIQRGKQPEYTEDGVKVIKTLNIQKGKINFDEVQFVSENFLENNKQKAGIHQFDLLLTSTGMGRGKVALYNGDEMCFADSHISIIRFDQRRMLPYFLNYYCQSFFGTEQLKYIEMHIKGTPEIYEEQLKYFQILDISLEAQQEIVSEIKTGLDKQEEMKKEIEAERNKIDEIIEQAIIE